jgi:hypothetical protein
MKLIKYFTCLALPLMLLSAKCKNIDTAEFVTKAEKNISYGGVYGSGYTKEYTITFSPKVDKVLEFDSIYIAADSVAYKKTSKERGWVLIKTENNEYYLNVGFQGGELLVPDGTVKMVEISTCAKPEDLEKNEAIVYGTYDDRPVTILIKKFSKKEDVFHP